MSIPGIDIAHAAIQRVDHGMGQPLTLDQAEEQIAHLLSRPRAELGQALAYLACQVVGYRHGQNSDATLAMTQVARIVREYEEKRR